MAENFETMFDNLTLSQAHGYGSETKPKPDVEKHAFDQLCFLVSKRLADPLRPNRSKRNDVEQLIRLLHIAGGHVTSTSEADEENKKLISLFETLFCFGKVHLLAHSEIGYSQEDFEDVADNAEYVMQCFGIFMSHIASTELRQSVQGNLLMSDSLTFFALILTIEHSKDDLWTTESSQQIADLLRVKVLRYWQCNTPADLFEYDQTRKIAKRVMLHIVQSFTKASWKQNPSIQLVYDWCLFNMVSPQIGDYLEYLLPPALLFLDDHELENKMHGINCMEHLIGNTSKAELSWLGRVEVIFDSLHKLMYTRDPDIMLNVHSSLIKVLLIIEPDPKSTNRPNMNSRSDAIFNKYLHDMNLETKLDLRRAYVKCLPMYVKHLGITILKHVKTFLHVVLEYLQDYDGPTEKTRLDILLCIEIFIKECWPRIPFHCETLVKGLVRYIYDISTDMTNTPEEVKTLAIETALNDLVLVKKTCPEKTGALLTALCNVGLSEICVEKIHSIVTLNE